MRYTLPMKFVIPDVVTSQFHLRPGDKVADFGTGRGFFVRPLSDVVTAEGEVYFCEIQKELVEFVGEQIRLMGYGHAKTMWCDLEEVNGISLPDGALDAGIIVNTLYQIEDRETAITEMLRTIRSGGKFMVVDWSETVPGLGPSLDRLLSAADCTNLLELHGCVLDREFPAGDHHYGLAFRKV